mgnify:CR=1 FL=1
MSSRRQVAPSPVSTAAFSLKNPRSSILPGETAEDINTNHRNTEYLGKDVVLPESLRATNDFSEAANCADVIVMGSRGHSTIGELLLGSVAHKVTMKADIPVMLVPSVAPVVSVALPVCVESESLAPSVASR